MKRTYYVLRGQFANIYTLAYAETDTERRALELHHFERISRKECEQLARREKYRRRVDEMFAHYADCSIRPANVILNHDGYVGSGYVLRGVIWEKEG